MISNQIIVNSRNVSSILISGLKSTDTVSALCNKKIYNGIWNENDLNWEIRNLPVSEVEITATDGSDTKTKTVSINEIGVYRIIMKLKLWLYKDGDECVNITGGWKVTNMLYVNAGSSQYQMILTKQENCLYVKDNGSYSAGVLHTINKLDLNGYSSVHMIGDFYNATSNSGYFRVSFLSDIKAPWASYLIGEPYVILPKTILNNIEAIATINNVSSGYPIVGAYDMGAGWAKIYKAWLE